MVKLVHRVAQLDVAEQQEPRVRAAVGAAVPGRLGRCVGEVDALAEHVPADGGLGRRDAEPLAEDSAVVGAPRAVPEEAAVAGGAGGVGGGLEAGFFAVTFDTEDVDDLGGIC